MYKAEQASRVVVLVEKSLSVRVHACPVCGLVIDRDENAANNILRLVLESLGVLPVRVRTQTGALEAPPFGVGSSHTVNMHSMCSLSERVGYQ